MGIKFLTKGYNLDMVKVTIVELFADRDSVPKEAAAIKVDPHTMLIMPDNILSIHRAKHDILGPSDSDPYGIKVIDTEKEITILNLHKPILWAALGKHYLPYMALAVTEDLDHFASWY